MKKKKHKKVNKQNLMSYPSGSIFSMDIGGTPAISGMGESDIRKMVREELFRLEESRLTTYTGDIMYSIGKNIPDLKIIASNSRVDGSEGLFRYKDGYAYEIQIRPVEYANDKEHWKKYTSGKSNPKKDNSSNKVTTEDVKQALWLAFKETVDKIEYLDTKDNFHQYKITYNETFDVDGVERNLRGLEEAGLGTFELGYIHVVGNGTGFAVIKHKNGTGDKLVYNGLFANKA